MHVIDMLGCHDQEECQNRRDVHEFLACRARLISWTKATDWQIYGKQMLTRFSMSTR